MNALYAGSIARLKARYADFDDVLHDWTHGERVAMYAKQIADSIGYQDKELLELCALWHDAARTLGIDEGHEEQSALLAKQDLLEYGASPDLAEKVYEAIRFHKTSARPATIEGKIVRDADKLDALTVDRWKKCANDGWKPLYVHYFKKTAEVQATLTNVLTYKLSKEVAEPLMQDFLRYYEAEKDNLPA